jgi:hypothetical protein
MAKSRKVGRKGSRKLGLFSRVYSPVNHLFQAAENSVNALTRGTGKIVHTGLNSVNKVGKSVAGHADKAVNGVVRGKSRKNRRSRRSSRKSRR